MPIYLMVKSPTVLDDFSVGDPAERPGGKTRCPGLVPERCMVRLQLLDTPAASFENEQRLADIRNLEIMCVYIYIYHYIYIYNHILFLFIIISIIIYIYT